MAGKKGKGLAKRASSNRGRCDKFFDYEAEQKRSEKKLRRILKSNGVDEARRWANAHGATSILAKVMK